MIDDRHQLTYYVASSEVLPDSHRFPWVAVGGGGVLTAKGFRVTAGAAVVGYRRSIARALVDERAELQVEFQGSTNAPTWASGAPGHVAWIDDGARALGVAIGTRVEFVNPTTGAIVYEIPSAAQPGGFTARQSYHLIKDGTAWWELFVNGRFVARLPYVGAAEGTFGVGTFGVGWQDATALAAGVGLWDRLETGVNEALPPNWKVDRVRDSLDGPVQEQWSERHEAIVRAIVGLQHGRQDAMSRLRLAFTGAVQAVQAGAFAGDELPDASGWTLGGDTGEFEVVRERVRINASDAITYAQFAFDTPTNTDGVFCARARFTVRDYTTTDEQGRVGPFVQIRDGHRRIGAFLVQEIGNPSACGWLISDNNPSQNLGNTGDVFLRVDPHGASYVELYLIGRERVLLFVNDELVEDVAYERFSGSTSDYQVRIGRDGSADISCTVDIEDAAASIEHGDNAFRPLFTRRVAERLLFAAGCERNDVLDTWMRHRGAVFTARGTDRVLSEIRRVACDDEAQLVVSHQPGDWYLGVTYPGISPVFIAANGEITRIAAEFSVHHAPNFQPDQLEELVGWYLLPRSAVELPVTSHRRATLTSSTAPDGDETEFDVDSYAGFEVGDEVTLREVTDGTLITVEYDSDEGLTALAANTVRDFSANGDDGVLSGGGTPDATIGNTDHPDRSGVVIPDDASAGDTEGVRAPSFSPTLHLGFTLAGRFTNDIAHDGTVWVLFKSTSGVGTGGYEVAWLATGEYQATIYDGSGSKQVTTSAQNPAAGTERHIAVRWDGASLLTIWIDGVQAAASANAAFTILNPGATQLGFGCRETGGLNKWKGRNRDHALWTRALTNDEIEDLYEDSSGRLPVRYDLELRLAYLPAGWPAVFATSAPTPPPIAADYMSISSFRGLVWATFGLVQIGESGQRIDGVFTVDGLDTDRQNDVTAGGIVKGFGQNSSVDVWLEVFGIEDGTGDTVTERIHVQGTAEINGTIEWASVHGIVCTPEAQGIVTLADVDSGDLLYQIAAGQRSSGCYLFDPPLLAGPAKITADANASTTDPFLLYGAEEAGPNQGYELTLDGTTEVETSGTWDTLRVIAAGYVDATRTITVTGTFTSPAGDLVAVSDNAGDVQGIRAFVLRTDGAVEVVEGTLDGTTPVTLSLAGIAPLHAWHVLGVELFGPAVGTVAVDMDGMPTGASDLEVCTFSAGESRIGVDRRRVDMTGEIRARLSGSLTTDRVLAVFGLDEAGAFTVEPIVLNGTEYVRGETSLRELQGIAVGHIPPSSWVRVAGEAWRYPHAREAIRLVSRLKGWTISGPGSGAIALDGILDTLNNADATLGPVEMEGSWSTSENTTITQLEQSGGDNVVHTQQIDGSFSSGAFMRRRQ